MIETIYQTSRNHNYPQYTSQRLPTHKRADSRCDAIVILQTAKDIFPLAKLTTGEAMGDAFLSLTSLLG